MAREIEQAQGSESGLSFGIQDTMEMGMGNSELLQDLLSPETVTTGADTLTDINDNTPPQKKKQPTPQSKKEEDNNDGEDDDDDDNDNAGHDNKKTNLLDSFLNDDSDDDDDDDDNDALTKTTKNTSTRKSKATAPSEDNDNDGGDDDNGSDNSGSGTQFEALANDLFNLGVFTKDPDEESEDVSIKTPEEFLERFNNEKKKGAIEMIDNFIGQFGQEYADAFDAIYVKGLNPKEYFQTALKIENFTDLDLTKESNQELVVRQALADQGFDQDDIDSEVERLKNYGDLESVSQRHHKVLIKKESAILAKKTQAAEEQQRQKLQAKQLYINNVNNILQEKIKEKAFDGIPLNPKTATELQDFLLVDKWKTDSGETLTDFDRYILELKRPENHATKVKVGLLIKLLQQDPTLSTIQKTGITKKTDALFKEVSKQVAKDRTVTTNNKPNVSSWFK